jgi:hypothetical protein
MKLGKAVLALLCTGLVFPSLASPESPWVPKGLSQDRDKLREEFSLVDSEQDLFAAGFDYLIQPTYEARGRIIEIRVVPKYFFNQTHPQWTEPTSPVVMPLTAYEALLHQIGAVKPLGDLIRQGQVGIMLNLRTTFRDQYEKGIVERAMFRASPEEAYGVAWFTVVYFRTIVGKLELKEAAEPPGPDRSYRIKIDGKWYWTTEKVFQGLTTGNKVKVEAGGPIAVGTSK